MKLVRISAIWCTSCILTKKDWDLVKENYEYEEYDYDLDSEIVKNYNIGNILPVIIVYKDDKEITRIVGEKSLKEIKEVLGD